MKKLTLFFALFATICLLTGCSEKHEITVPPQTERTFSELRWPSTEIAKLVPVPKSNLGDIAWSADYGFVIFVANTTFSDFNEYADGCETLGFIKEYRRGETYMIADNADGYHVSLRLDDGNVMVIRLEEPKEPEGTTTTATTATAATTVETTTSTSETTNDLTDAFSGSIYETTAKLAIQQHGEYLYPYGFDCHWSDSSIVEYEGKGIWYLKVNVTITDQYIAKKDAVAEGRVNFIEETVSEFDILPFGD